MARHTQEAKGRIPKRRGVPVPCFRVDVLGLFWGEG